MNSSLILLSLVLILASVDQVLGYRLDIRNIYIENKLNEDMKNWYIRATAGGTTKDSEKFTIDKNGGKGSTNTNEKFEDIAEENTNSITLKLRESHWNGDEDMSLEIQLNYNDLHQFYVNNNGGFNAMPVMYPRMGIPDLNIDGQPALKFYHQNSGNTPIAEFRISYVIS